MRKSIHSPEYQRVLSRLVEMRERAGLTQRDLARKLGREHSFVWRIEKGERRLDLVEFYWVCLALGENASAVYERLINEIRASEPEPKTEETPPPRSKAAEPGPAYKVTKPKR